MITPRPLAITAAAAIAASNLVAASASAGDVELTFTKPTGTGTVDVKLEPGADASAIISSAMTATQKRDTIKTKLEAKGYTCESVGTAGLKIKDLHDGTKVTFVPGPTGEKKDTQTASLATGGEFGFASATFQPFDAQGQLAVFTGGFVTRLGAFSAEVSSFMLPTTEGAVIAQALFQQLAPMAPAYGAHLSYGGGDTLSVAFDPSVAQGAGVIFGTTSLTAGAYGSVALAPEPASLCTLAASATLLLRRRRAPA